MDEIFRGAEAVIYKDKDKIIKHRIPKSYRHKIIDDNLRKQRTRREAKIIEKIQVPSPKLISVNGKEMKIEMEFIDGDKLRDVFDLKYCSDIGKNIAIMHNQDIIHGDLTTSNMIVKKGVIYFIDFGLSFFSKKIEDKAVDLHLLKQALESSHYLNYKTAFNKILTEYKKICINFDEILTRFEIVESRGRNKTKHL